MITDRYQRRHDYLRISLTDRCNLRCRYCMPDENYPFMSTSRLMKPKEIDEIVQVFVSLGVRKIRLTGGEPLARPEFSEILSLIARYPVSLKLTTNATLLHRHLPALKEAGVDTLNISLDTLSEKSFLALTRSDRFSQTINNIQKAVAAGLNIKINTVLMKGANDHELIDFIEWSARESVEVRFIEYMPFTGNRWSGDKVISRKEMLDILRQKYIIESVPNDPNATTASYRITGLCNADRRSIVHPNSSISCNTRFAIISTMSAPFCAGCNRIRLTADGKMKNCLFSKDETNLLDALRSGLPIEPLIRKNVMAKAPKLGGQFGDHPFDTLQAETLENRSMISIGG